METIITVLTVLALILINTAILMYEPRTRIGAIGYAILVVPAFFLLLSAMCLILAGG